LILYIAEKPSLARAIVEVLPKPHKKEKGFIRVGNGDCVSWCIGHLLEHAEPDAYDEKYKQWRMAHLPIFPQQWQLKPKPKTRSQLVVLKKLFEQADQLVHAGDPDREGQLLVDQVIAYHKVPASKIKTLKRCLISDMNPSAVKRAIAQLRDNKEFASLSASALARTRADWLYGINLTRAYTIQGRKVGYSGVLSVGRVQTPILGLVVRRDKEIEAFSPTPFYEVRAHIQAASVPDRQLAASFTAKWKPSEACHPYMDDENRVVVKKLAENVVQRIHGKQAVVKQVDESRRKQAPPLPYNLSALQIDAARLFALSASQVLESCQLLYEKHKLITYPRSDTRYLPLTHYSLAKNVLSSVAHNSATLRPAVESADFGLKTQAWNDKKVEAHHAIIPTEKRLNIACLTVQERKIYELICRQYLYQFFPNHEYFESRVEIVIEGGLFVATDKRITLAGWKSLNRLFAGRPFAKSQSPLNAQTGEQDVRSLREESENLLPELKNGDILHCERGELLEKNTQPPKPFSDATLLTAITGISRFVKDPKIKKILRETDGLGTEATRASIIELLFSRGYLKREKKHILSTAAGRGLIESLPEKTTRPDMTAEWEFILNAISARQSSYQVFMSPLIETVQSLVEQSKRNLPMALKGVQPQATACRQ